MSEIKYCDTVCLAPRGLPKARHTLSGELRDLPAGVETTNKRKCMKQKFLKADQLKQLLKNHAEQDGTKEFKAVVKFFNPSGIGTWFLSEYDPERKVFFGLCCLHDKELGYVTEQELKEIKCPPFGLGIERDSMFEVNKYTLEECEKLVA
jgi:hypothetical protein